MRWFWIDRFVEFERGSRAVAVKGIALVEEEIDEYLPGYPILPNSLIIEGMAQTAGLLIGESSGFEERVVLAKINKAVFHRPAEPGNVLRYTATVENMHKHGAVANVTSHLGDELQAEADLMFAFLDDRFPSGPLFDPVEFIAMVRAFGIFDIGKTTDGTPFLPPPKYLEAERLTQAKYESGAVKIAGNA